MSREPLRIGSLFTGTGALDLAVMDVFDAEVVWHSQYEPPDKNGKEDTNQYAAKILARHWPDAPNLGDITRIDWQATLAEHGPVDILTGGFPCQDVSSAGRRAGIADGTRSGLWAHFARAIHELRPQLVVIENVEGLLSAKAAGDMELCPHCVGDDSAQPPLRALGAVLGDLASLGFDAEWCRIAASEVGAPHPRKRVFILAWPAAADPTDNGHERPGTARRRGTGPADGYLAAADTDSGGLEGYSELPAGRDALRQRVRDDADRRDQTPADTPSLRRGQGGAESARVVGGSDVALGRDHAVADADSRRWRAEVLHLRSGKPDVDWGAYEPAIRRWEHILGRPAPWPTDFRGRLTPVFSEWMMGLPDGWVTCTPGPAGMSLAALRNAMLRALGNGVVRLQAATGIRLLAARAGLALPLNRAAALATPRSAA